MIDVMFSQGCREIELEAFVNLAEWTTEAANHRLLRFGHFVYLHMHWTNSEWFGEWLEFEELREILPVDTLTSHLEIHANQSIVSQNDDQAAMLARTIHYQLALLGIRFIDLALAVGESSQVQLTPWRKTVSRLQLTVERIRKLASQDFDLSFELIARAALSRIKASLDQFADLEHLADFASSTARISPFAASIPVVAIS